ncbi:Glutathione S-transferase F14 [Picochlorum sp. SENEW3]|nr:Glutathione S-transferase F14 [Picochlorum sp. SENEW3]
MHRFASIVCSSMKGKKFVLYDVPVSNNGARIRNLIYKKKLDQFIDIKSPMEIGGLRSETYRQLNPYGKMPVLEMPDGSGLPESQVIESYILDKFRDNGPSLIPDTAEKRALAALVVRIHDLYIAPIQGCLYKPMDSAEERAEGIAQIAMQLDTIERYCTGPFICGSEMSYADTAIMPTFVFLNYILPRFFGWKDGIFLGRPKLGTWWDCMNKDDDTARVIREVESGLESWNASNRWEEKGILKDVSDTRFCWNP